MKNMHVKLGTSTFKIQPINSIAAKMYPWVRMQYKYIHVTQYWWHTTIIKLNSIGANIIHENLNQKIKEAVTFQIKGISAQMICGSSLNLCVP